MQFNSIHMRLFHMYIYIYKRAQNTNKCKMNIIIKHYHCITAHIRVLDGSIGTVYTISFAINPTI